MIDVPQRFGAEIARVSTSSETMEPTAPPSCALYPRFETHYRMGNARNVPSACLSDRVEP